MLLQQDQGANISHPQAVRLAHGESRTLVLRQADELNLIDDGLPDIYQQRLTPHASGMRSYVHASALISVAGALSLAVHHLDLLCPSLAVRAASIDW
jgi:hypothetical protein